MPKGGFRPGAGRKSLDEEQRRLRDMFKCFDVVMEFVNSDAPLKERAEMAVKLAVKTIPEKLEHSGANGMEFKVVHLMIPNAPSSPNTKTIPSNTALIG